jgi:non-ribosomal peptide synthetase component F
LNYATALFDRETVERHVGYLRRALRQMAADDEQAVSRVDLLSAQERERLLVQWNRTAAWYPKDKCLHELFEEQVARAPDAVAVEYEGEQLSYGQLNARANQLAHYLSSQGVGPDSRVAICVERSLEMVVGLLGTLKAGAAYVPLDPSYPAERLQEMLRDCEPQVLLTHQAALGAVGAALQGYAVPVVELDERSVYAEQSPENLSCAQVGLTSQHLAYIIYTSGSTGKPKGALNYHTGLVNRICWMQGQMSLSAEDAVLQKTPISFLATELWSEASRSGSAGAS